jgi:hypothetical protein
VQALATRVAQALTRPSPRIGPHRRLWLVGTGPYHDAADLGTFPFAGSGRSVAAVSAEGHVHLGGLLGPQDACLLVGGDRDLEDYATRVADGAGATMIRLDVDGEPSDDPTAAFAIAGSRVLALCRSLDAPGLGEDDLDGLGESVARASSAGPVLSRDWLGPRAIIMGSGPAAVTARHLAVVLRRADPSLAVEGLDAQDVPGLAANHLRPGTTVLALDPGRDPEAPVARMARMAATEGATVIELAAPADLAPVVAQIPLAVAAARALTDRRP